MDFKIECVICNKDINDDNDFNIIFDKKNIGYHCCSDCYNKVLTR
jgi:hypothetical protein